MRSRTRTRGFSVSRVPLSGDWGCCVAINASTNEAVNRSDSGLQGGFPPLAYLWVMLTSIPDLSQRHDGRRWMCSRSGSRSLVEGIIPSLSVGYRVLDTYFIIAAQSGLQACDWFRLHFLSAVSLFQPSLAAPSSLTWSSNPQNSIMSPSPMLPNVCSLSRSKGRQ